jgi:hypothetical protein
VPTQIKLDLLSTVKTPIEDEKKDSLVSFRIGEKFKADLSEMAKAKGLNSLSDLVAEYVIEKYSEDYKSLLLLKLKERKTVREIMAQS